MVDQQRRVAVVTGAGRGLGQAFALGLAERGDAVVAVARTADQLRETERLAVGASGSVVRLTCDVSDHRAVAALADEIRSRLGSPSILVNAAGIFGPIDLIRDADPEHWQRTTMVDAVAAFYTANAFIGDMLDAGWGRIVNVTSAASLHPPGPINSAYSTAKAAL
ncbi:MAG: SDR family oxidoreductase, partial [Chloroflexota bacterium]|nr:SDR family oxidoreductase [Chloroflexota bacterium]